VHFSKPLAIDLIKLAAPLAFVNVCTIGMFAVAMMVAGSFSVQELAALGFTLTLIVTTVVFFFMLLSAIIPITANLKGAGNLSSELPSLLRSALVIASVLSIIAVIALTLLEALLPLITNAEEISSLVKEFLSIAIWGVPLDLLACAIIFISNGAGRTFWPAAVSAGAFIAMVLVTWLIALGNAGFVAMGSAGIAYSFLLAMLTKFVFSILLLLQEDFRSLTFTEFTGSLDVPYLRRIFNIGFPIGLNEGSIQLFGAVLIIFIASMGAEQLAVHNVAWNVFSFCHVFSLGFMTATSILVGQALGAEDLVGLKSVRRTSHYVVLMTSFPMLLALYFFRNEIAVAYSIDGDTKTLWLQICFCILFLKVLDDIALAGQGFLLGLERTRVVFSGRFIGCWVVAMPVGYTLSAHYNLSGYWIGMAIGTALTLIWFVRAGSTYLALQNPKLVAKE
jgi:MATE family multidrug resistance protein